MQKYRGVLRAVSKPQYFRDLRGIEVDMIQIGDRTLRGVKVDDTAWAYLEANPTREVCLYVLRLPGGALPFSLTPNLLGMKYLDTGEKHLIAFAFARNSMIRYAVIPALVWSFAFGIAGLIASNVLRSSGMEPGIVSYLGGIGFVGGWLLAWGCSVRIGFDYLRARID